ncbi:MAG: DUF1080 domain-containing protein [Zavarzinella sp.]
MNNNTSVFGTASRLLLAVILVAASTNAPCLAADEAKLTAEELQEGWLQFFDGTSTLGWKITGDAKVKDHTLILGGEKETTATPDLLLPTIKHLVQLKMSWTGKKPPTVETADGNISEFMVNSTKDDVNVFGWGNPAKSGNKVVVPVSLKIPAGTTVRLHYLRLNINSDFTSLFNGKDLTGWKLFPGDKYKSQYTVTKEGYLNVKDGPGDLQTATKHDNFLLHLECISNGKHLNSGIFFRCLPDVYQQGYEMQIRNEWMGDDRTKPVDFGTGAIYRRQPASQVVSTDGEWFHATLYANKNHLRTWVNGIPVVSWHDDRAADVNARKGYCAGAGHISIQGHDPTTDLSFRNLRIVDLK